MGVVDAIFSTFSGFYNNVNPITLSGVNDVIVIKDLEGNLKCTPFQLRFTRLTFLTAKNQVHLYVNNKLTDIDMTLTSQGDLIFEDQTHKCTTELSSVLSSKESQIVRILQTPSDLLKKYDASAMKKITEIRTENLKFRVFSRAFLRRDLEDPYNELVKKYSKFSYFVGSNENLEYLLKNVASINNILEFLMNLKSFSSTIEFSQCMFNKIDIDHSKTFQDFQIKEITSPENTIVKLTDHRECIFYISFTMLSRIYFELITSKCKLKRLKEFLENEYNKTLGWNIFKGKKFIKRDVSFSLILKSDDLKSLDLKSGKNDIVFKIAGINKQLEGSIYLYNITDKIVISDIDGTITKSDIRGHIYNMVGKDWTHSGIASLYTKIHRNGYKILYLTHRPLGQSSITKKYLRQVQQDCHSLPDGPVIHSPNGVLETVYAEVILKQPERFKIECLTGIKELFNGKSPFVAGFGNKITDVVSYKAVDIPTNRIYTINDSGQIQAEYTKGMVGTYHTINEFVDSIFPPLGNKQDVDYNYSEFSYWRNK